MELAGERCKRCGGPNEPGVVTEARSGAGCPADRIRDASRRLHEQTGRTAGNGALTRTGVVGLVALRNPEQTAEAEDSVDEHLKNVDGIYEYVSEYPSQFASDANVEKPPSPA